MCTSLVSWGLLVGLLLVQKSEMIFRLHSGGKDGPLNNGEKSAHPLRKDRKGCYNFILSWVMAENLMSDFLFVYIGGGPPVPVSIF